MYFDADGNPMALFKGQHGMTVFVKQQIHLSAALDLGYSFGSPTFFGAGISGCKGKKRGQKSRRKKQ